MERIISKMKMSKKMHQNPSRDARGSCTFLSSKNANSNRPISGFQNGRQFQNDSLVFQNCCHIFCYVFKFQNGCHLKKMDIILGKILFQAGSK